MKMRLYVVGILGGIGLLAITLVVVLAFGRHHPSPPLLKDNPKPEIPGEILYRDADGCFVRAQASGAGEEQLGCAQVSGAFGGRDFHWPDRDTFLWVRREGPGGGRLIEVDLPTGVQTDTGEFISAPEFPINSPPFEKGLRDGIQGPDGRWAFSDDDGNLVIASGDARVKVASFDLPEFARPNIRGWSPDSQWVMLEYWARNAVGPELWIVKADGSVRGTLTKDMSPGTVAWRIEGVGSWPPRPE